MTHKPPPLQEDERSLITAIYHYFSWKSNKVVYTERNQADFAIGTLADLAIAESLDIGGAPTAAVTNCRETSNNSSRDQSVATSAHRLSLPDSHARIAQALYQEFPDVLALFPSQRFKTPPEIRHFSALVSQIQYWKERALSFEKNALVELQKDLDAEQKLSSFRMNQNTAQTTKTIATAATYDDDDDDDDDDENGRHPPATAALVSTNKATVSSVSAPKNPPITQHTDADDNRDATKAPGLQSTQNDASIQSTNRTATGAGTKAVIVAPPTGVAAAASTLAKTSDTVKLPPSLLKSPPGALYEKKPPPSALATSYKKQHASSSSRQYPNLREMDKKFRASELQATKERLEVLRQEQQQQQQQQQPSPSPPRKRPRGPNERLTTWGERIRDLEHFWRGHGHCRVPTRERGLGKWVGAIRAVYRKSQADPSLLQQNPTDEQSLVLTEKRIGRLEKMGFEWDLGARTVSWELRYQELLQFKNKYRHTRVLRNWKENPQFGEWVHMQRKLKRQNQLRPERLEKLNAIDFTWDSEMIKPKWEERVDACRNYRREHGNLTIPPLPSDPTEVEKLDLSREELGFRRWAQRQRDHFRRFYEGRQSCLTTARIKQLTDIGFEWILPDHMPRRVFDRDKTSWEDRYKELAQFQKEFGHCRVPIGRSKKLAAWVGSQRLQYRRKAKSIMGERVEKLNAIGFEWIPARQRQDDAAGKEIFSDD